jgi:hypothetical protein
MVKGVFYCWCFSLYCIETTLKILINFFYFQQMIFRPSSKMDSYPQYTVLQQWNNDHETTKLKLFLFMTTYCVNGSLHFSLMILPQWAWK